MTVHRSSLNVPYLRTSGPNGVYYEDTFWDDLRVAAESTRINPATSKPDYGAFPVGATYTKTFLFDSSAREAVTFSVQIPHKYKLGTDLHPHVHYSPTVTDATSKTITWELNYRIANIDDAFAGSDTTLSQTYTGATVANTHMLLGLGTISGSVIDSISTMLVCALSRRGDTDTYGSDVAFLEFDFHFEVDSPGSRSEYVK